jgi:hypothetical protein
MTILSPFPNIGNLYFDFTVGLAGKDGIKEPNHNNLILLLSIVAVFCI